MSSEYGGFEWDAAKAVANRRDHGVAFEDAVVACSDPFAVERVDEREDYGEDRNVRWRGPARHLHGTRFAHANHLGPAGGKT